MSFQINIDPKSQKAGRFITHVIDALRRTLAEEHQRTGLTQAKIAEVLGVDKAVINRKLNGEGNLTLRTIAEQAYVMGDRDIVFELHRQKQVVNTVIVDAPPAASVHNTTRDIKVGVA